ncbi:MAG: hypothetical protein N2383_07235 [Caldilineales bacterium]|nr:hypothetical protein [Caldilineales bacterium]
MVNPVQANVRSAQPLSLGTGEAGLPFSHLVHSKHARPGSDWTTESTLLPPFRDIAAIAAGARHTCTLTVGGGVKCWGWNWFGQLGDRTTRSRGMPVDVMGLAEGVVAIAAGGSHTCALTTGGGVKCWGWNGDGQLGDGTTSNRSTPVDVAGLTNGVAAIAAGYRHTCALTTGGGVKCWGGNGSGQLGDGTWTSRSTPVDVVGLTEGVTAIAAGGEHTCALTARGGIKCWGFNWAGQLGDGTRSGHSTPVDVVDLTGEVRAIAAGGAHTCALTIGSGVMCWGANESGQLGDGTMDDQRSTPGSVVGLTDEVRAIIAGGSHTCALTTGGGVTCWGQNGFGQLGDGTTAARRTPVNVIGVTNEIAAIAAGGAHTCVLTTGGGVKCWGDNRYDQLGDGTTNWYSTPVDIVGLTSEVRSIAAGDAHTCALTTGNEVKCWGYNEWGQLGDGTTTDRGTPANVTGLMDGVMTVTAGSYHTAS